MTESILSISNWSDLIVAILLFAIIYILALWANMSSARGQARFSDRQIRFMRYLYVPIAGLILTALFVSINPIVHGAIILLMIWAFGSWLRNALTGALIKYQQQYKPGEHYVIDGIHGRLVDMGLDRATLTHHGGLMYVPYVRLQSRAVLHDQARSEEVSVYVTREQSPPATRRIQAALFDCPLISPDTVPSVIMQDHHTAYITASLSSGSSASALITYLGERLSDHNVSRILVQ